MGRLSRTFIDWLENHADELNVSSGDKVDQLLKKIAEQGIFKIAVPVELGGVGGSISDLIEAVTELGYYSLTAAFISWGHGTLIQNILASENSYPRDNWLPSLLTGEIAGGTGLSNAVKFLSGIEELNVSIVEENGQFYLNGRLPWVTNVRSDAFVTVFAANYQDQPDKTIILSVPSWAGIDRSDDLQFVSLQGANTASLTFDKVPLDENWILSDSAVDYIGQTRPFFLGLQFALAFGLSQRSLHEVEGSLNSNRSVLDKEYRATLGHLQAIKEKLYTGLSKIDYFVKAPKELFQLRLDIVDLVSDSLLLELQASGGRGYFKNSPSSFMRRWNEGAFLPIISPSAVQLRHILNH